MSDLLQGLATNAPAILKTLLLYEFQVTIFVLIVLGIDHWLRRAAPRFRYALWLVVLVKTLWPPSFTIPGFTVLPAVTIELPALAITATGGGVPVQQSSLPLITILLLLWGLMSAGLLLLMLISFVSFRLRLRVPHAHPWQPGTEITAKDRTWPPIWYTDRIPSPLTLGLIKPRIYLTPAAAESDPVTLAAILHHELAHVRRRDGWVTLLQGAALVIHPFNPLVWLMNRRLTSYREQVCDDFALRHTAIAPREYGRALLDQLGRSVPAPLMLHPKTLFFETKRDLKQRLQQLLTRKEGTMNNHTTIRQKLLLAGLMAGLLFISSQCQEESIELSKTQPTAPTSEITGGPTPKRVSYAMPPEPIGGYAAIQQHVVYPGIAREAGIEGTVIIQAFVDENGQVQRTVVRKGIPNTGLDEAAVETIRQSTWEPAKQSDGQPVGVWVSIPVSFSLDEDVTAEPKSLPEVPPEFVPYDEPPRPIGGYAAIMEHVVYPEEAQEAGIEGTVMVQAFITEDGKTSEITVFKNDTGDPSLGDAAVTAIQNTAFEPAKQEGKPVGVWIVIPVNFRLAGKAVEDLQTEAEAPTGELIYNEVEPPQIIDGALALQQQLVYPEKAKAAGIEGKVVISAYIAEDGNVGEVRVEENFTGDASLGEAAVAAIQNLSFEPGKEMGNPVGVWISFPVNFRLSK